MKRLIFLLISLSLSAQASSLNTKAAEALKQKNASLALRFLKTSLEAEPKNLTTILQMATAYIMQHNFEQAVASYERALELQPFNANAHFNCGILLSVCGKFEQATEHFEQAYQLKPLEQTSAHLFKHYIRQKAWKKAEAIRPSSLWWYQTPLTGKTVFLDLDKPGNGLGDSIQFIRYAQTLHQAGAQVIVRCAHALEPLFSLVPYIHKIVAPDQPIPHHDLAYDICIASQLISLKDTIAMQTPVAPYLSAKPDLIASWNERIAQNTQLKIGLCWNTNLVYEFFSEKITTSPRSIAIHAFKPLSSLPANFYSLQKTVQLTNAPFEITQFIDDFDESNGRFMDTAAVIMNLDLVISVDTSVAHLAGALGKPVWLLLSCESDYRWFTDDDYSPLYPTMRIFRQTNRNDWTDVIAHIKSELQSLTGQKDS